MALDPGPPQARCNGCGARYDWRGGILDLTTSRKGAPGYDPHFFSSLSQVEERHFWYLSRREVVLDALERSVPDLRTRPLFDIGCGSGGLLAFLERHLPVGGACDAHRLGLELARQRTAVPLLLVDDGRTPPLAEGQTMLGLFDVLEHLDDDEGTLRWLFAILAPGGVLALTVPAHPILFGEVDRLACHRRRYRRDELLLKLRRAGFQVRLLTHFMAPLVPLLLLFRQLTGLLDRLGFGSATRSTQEQAVVPVFNGLMRALLRVERVWLRHFELPFGSSLIAVAARPCPEGPGAGRRS